MIQVGRDRRMWDFLATMAGAADVGCLWDSLTGYFERQGVDQIACLHFAPPGAAGEGPNWARLKGFSSEWVSRYFDGGQIHEDPIRAHAAVCPRPFRWSELPSLRPLSAAQKNFLAELGRQRGGGDGLAIPVFGPGGRNGFVAIGLPPGQADIPRERMLEYSVVAQFAHQRFCEFIARGEAVSPALSRREQEVLFWVARGKSNGVIAEILGVSANTIDTHLRRIFGKLDVTDRVSAALAGIGRGVIKLD